ncbi:MAG: CHAD domain-containing protein [Gammaproteobacteria bacterium]
MAHPAGYYCAPSRVARRELERRLELALGARASGGARLQRTWYDTPDWRLYRAGWLLEHDIRGARGELRLRRLGKPEPDLTAFAALPPQAGTNPATGPLRDALAAHCGRRALVPYARANVNSRGLEVVNAEGKTTVRLAVESSTRLDPQLRAGRRLAPVVRLSPLRGYQAEAIGARAALADLGLVPAASDPMLAALDDSSRRPLDYSPHPRVPVGADEPPAAAVARLLRAYFAVMQCNVEGIRTDLDTECLHDFRTAMRRSRTLLAAFGVVAASRRAPFRSGFSWLSAVTGALRDLDVFIEAVGTWTAPAPASARADAQRLERWLRERRARALEDVRTALASARWQAFAAAWGGFIDRLERGEGIARRAAPTLRQAARDALARVLEPVLERGGAIEDGSPVAELHELRKDAKKLRYLLEAVALLCRPREHAAVIALLKGLQDNLGDLCDLETQRRILGEQIEAMCREPAPGPGPGVIRLAQDIQATLAGRAVRPRQRFAANYARFSRPKSIRRLRRLLR